MSTPVQPALAAALADRYRLEREIGQGGMATVYLAHDLKHERDVAIKVLHPDLGAALGAERFLSEIKTTARLQHPHILPLLDSGSADGLLWYAMPFVEGETLRARLARETQLPIAEAVRLAREVADALQAAHARGVVHRDIKPENILLQGGPGTPHALVADFGIALAVQSASGARMTQTGLSLGTPQYMSPEQATGERVIDARSDLYALGAVTYEMLVGEPPFTGPNTQAIVARLLSTAPAPPTATRSTIPPHVEAAVLTALAKLPADRQASVAEFSAQLTGAAPIALTESGDARLRTGLASGAPHTPPHAARALRRSRVLLAVASTIAFAALGTVAWLLSRPDVSAPTTTFTLSLPDTARLVSAAFARRIAISRDGRQVYFVGGSGPDVGLFRRDLSDTLVQRVAGTERAHSPVPCPDGRWLYFNLGTGQGIMRVPPEGGRATLVVDSASVTDCNDAGDLLIARDRSLLLWREGQPPRLLVRPDSARGEIAVGSSAFLPGGTHAVFGITYAGQGALGGMLATVPLAGGATTPLELNGVRPRAGNGYLLFVREGELLGVRWDRQRNRVVGQPVSVVRDVASRTQGSDYDVSDDGTLVYASGSFGSRYNLVRVDRAGRETVLDREPAQYSWPRVSPDGKRIAVEVGDRGTGYDVWLFTVASRSLERLTSGFSGVRSLGWSADGRRVAYLTMENGGTPQQKRTITWLPWDLSAPPERIPVRIPDGTQVEDATLRSSTDLVLIRSRGYGSPGDLWVAPPPPSGDSVRQARPFVVTDADEETPRLSPDGRWMAYASSETGQFEVYARAADGTGGRVPISAGFGVEPVWTPDGRGLYFRGERRMQYAALKGGASIEVMRRDTLFDDPYRRESLSVPYDVFPDGQSLLMQKPSGQRSPYPIVVLNWPALLTQRNGSAPR